MADCKRTCLHRTFVYEYRVARHAQELQREEATLGYATEMKNHNPIITFQDWLKGLGREQE